MCSILTQIVTQLSKVVDPNVKNFRMAKKFEFFVLAVALLQVAQPIFSARILGYLLSPSQSHFVIHDSLMRGLAAKGHNVIIHHESKIINSFISIHIDNSTYSACSRVPRSQSRTTASYNWNQTTTMRMLLPQRRRECCKQPTIMENLFLTGVAG